MTYRRPPPLVTLIAKAHRSANMVESAGPAGVVEVLLYEAGHIDSTLKRRRRRRTPHGIVGHLHRTAAAHECLVIAVLFRGHYNQCMPPPGLSRTLLSACKHGRVCSTCLASGHHSPPAKLSAPLPAITSLIVRPILDPPPPPPGGGPLCSGSPTL